LILVKKILLNRIHFILNYMNKRKIIYNLCKEIKKLIILGKIKLINTKIINKKIIHQ